MFREHGALFMRSHARVTQTAGAAMLTIRPWASPPSEFHDL